VDTLPFVASAVASGVVTYLFIPWLIRSLRGTSLVGKDLNKRERPMVPEMGGIGVILGFYVGVAVITIVASHEVLAIIGPFYYVSLSAALGAGVVGLFDDMFRFRQRTKAIVPFVLALPLGAAVFSSGDVYFLGLNIGLLMVLVVPLGVTSAANAANMLEGFNGLGAGLMIIISVALIALSVLQGAQGGLFILFPLVGALVAFFWFNRFPAKVFPGDSMTLFAGAAIACAAIISFPPLKTQGALLFTPMIAEFFLKARGRFKGENYGTVDSTGRLGWDGPIESLSHILMRWLRPTEVELVLSLFAIEILVALAVIAMAVAGVV